MSTREWLRNLLALVAVALPLEAGAAVVNIDFNGVRNVPGPDEIGPTYSGIGPAGGGEVWNGILADSRLEDGTDNDNLTIEARRLLDDTGVETTVAFQVSPVGGDVCCAAPVTDEMDPLALLNDYIFNNSAGNTAGESPFTISGLGGNDRVDIYFYIRSGSVTVAGSTGERLDSDEGVFTGANTVIFRDVPVMAGTVRGTMGGGTAVLWGLSISTPGPLPRATEPSVRSVSPTGNTVRTSAEIAIELEDSETAVATDSIQLFLNGAAVTPVIRKEPGSAITTVVYTPEGGLPESTNRVGIVFATTGTPPILQTNEFTFSVINDDDARLVVNVDLNGLRPDDAEGPTFSGPGAAGGGTVFNSIVADSTAGDDNLTVEGTNLLNSIGESAGISFSISPVGGDNNGAGETPELPSALFGDYVFVGSAGQTSGTSEFTIGGLGDVPAVDLYFYYGISPAVDIPGTQPAPFAEAAPFTGANTLHFRAVPVSGGSVTGGFGRGQVAILSGFSVRKPAPGPFVRATSPSGTAVLEDTPIRIELLDYVTEVQTNSVQLLVNGTAVTPVVSRPGGTNLTLVEYHPAALPEGVNRVVLIHGDSASPSVLRTNEFGFEVVSRARAASVINIDFNGVRNVPGPDTPGSTFSGQSAAGGGAVWNGIAVDSRLDDGTDEDNLTIVGEDLVNSLGESTSIRFEVSPVGGDNGGGPAPDPINPAALLDDYFFNNSAANLAEESPFTISGLGDVETVDLYFYRGAGVVAIGDAEPSPFSGGGIFTSGNTVLFRDVPVTGGAVSGVFGPGTTVIYGLSIRLPAEGEEPEDSLAIAQDGESITISWSSGAVLQATDAIGGAWSDVPGASSPYRVNATESARFFRLRR